MCVRQITLCSERSSFGSLSRWYIAFIGVFVWRLRQFTRDIIPFRDGTPARYSAAAIVWRRVGLAMNVIFKVNV